MLTRQLESLLEELVRTTPVVILEGGRAVGKSTVCDELIGRLGWQPRLDLSDESVMATLRLDPDRFLAAQRTPCVLDEAQLEPRLTIWVKRRVDQRRAPGQFLLTGSARLGRDQLGGSDPLAGRAVRVRMWSMTEAEIAGRRSDFVQRAFGSGWSITSQPATPEQARPQSRLGGLAGLSGVLRPATVSQWEREIAAYVEAVMPIAAGGTRADTGRLLRTFRYFASGSGQLVNFASAASDLGMQATTVRNHLELLENAFLLVRVEAERPTEARVVTAHPRVFATDTGLATWAARAWSRSLPAALAGTLTETGVAHDLLANVDANAERITVRHWRDDRNKREVDLLLVHPDGRYVPIEVKASTSAGPGDTAGLTAFTTSTGNLSVRGLLIYEGDQIVDLTPANQHCQILAVPRRLL